MIGKSGILAFAAPLAAALVGSAVADTRSCTSKVGPRRAAELARLCREISPATHPPCNVADSCALIENEIRRSCRLAEDDAPDWCSAYTSGADSDDEDE